MKTMLKAVSVVGISAAALGLAGLACSAHAQDITSWQGEGGTKIQIPVADLNLNTPAGAERFNARVDRVAQQICLGYDGVGQHAQCMEAVHEEANANLTHQQDQVAALRQQGMAVASVQEEETPVVGVSVAVPQR